METILVLHFGGGLAAHAARLIRQEKVYCQVLPCNATAGEVQTLNPIGILLAGEQLHTYALDPAIDALQLPTLALENIQDCSKIAHFLRDGCKARCDWNMDAFIENAILEIREQVGLGGRVLLGLSGGVDSSVCAALLFRAIGDRLDCVFVNHGLMRKGEPEEVSSVFTRTFPVNLIAVDASHRFFEKLQGVVDPEHKRKVIGAEFIDVFAEEAERLGQLDYLAQGTIYPDILESGSAPGEKPIKSHHNVGGLPEHLKFKGLVEPLKMLFKDEVRAVGMALGLPAAMVGRQPFPGPGLGVRTMGELTRAKVHLTREADAIWREELAIAGVDKELSQYFAVLTGAKSVGIHDGQRAYDDVICLRAVHTVDFVTADWARIPYDVVQKASQRITGEIPGVSRVVLDVTAKPPSAIEWE